MGADPVTASVIGGASLVSGLMGSSSAKSAAKTQANAAKSQAQVYQNIYDQTREDLSPYRELGTDASTAYNYLMGLSSDNKLSDGSSYSFETSPSYQFNLQQGLNAVDASAATKGGLLSGATLKAAQEYGSGLASNEYQNTLSNLGSLINTGQNAAAGTASAGNTYAAGTSSALSQAANATSAGTMASSNALTGIMGNALGTYTLLNKLGTS